MAEIKVKLVRSRISQDSINAERLPLEFSIENKERINLLDNWVQYILNNGCSERIPYSLAEVLGT